MGMAMVIFRKNLRDIDRYGGTRRGMIARSGAEQVGGLACDATPPASPLSLRLRGPLHDSNTSCRIVAVLNLRQRPHVHTGQPPGPVIIVMQSQAVGHV